MTCLSRNQVHVVPVLIQPMAADEVAGAVGRISVRTPVNGTVEVGGPQNFRLDELIRRFLGAFSDRREVVADPDALYSGARLSERSLVPENDATLGAIRFEDWLVQESLEIRGQAELTPILAPAARLN